MDQRQQLAERATEIFNSDGAITYSQAIDQALEEKNPTENSTIAGLLIQALLNVNNTSPPVFKRHEFAIDPSDAELR